MTRRFAPSTIAALAAGAVAMVVAAVQLRHGVVQILDTGSYLSGAQAVRSGRPFTSTLAPSFSEFSAIEFLECGGRLPFVDFPLGYPLLAGLIGLVTGAKAALGVVVFIGTVATAMLFAHGPASRTDVQRETQSETQSETLREAPPDGWGAPALRAAIAVGVIVMPTFRLVVQGGLSEPLFGALALGLAWSLVRYRATGERFALALGCAVGLGLVRFIGAPLSVLLVLEDWRRRRSVRRALAIAAVSLVPTGANIVWASAVGGGHAATWHGIQRLDVRLFARSISGWFDKRAGDLGETLLRVGDVVPWFGYPLTFVWIALVGWAAISLVRPAVRRSLPYHVALPLTMAGVLAASLFAGLATFDALATPDNRITLPIGVLTLAAAAWAIPATLRSTAAGLIAVVVALWLFVGAGALRAADSFGSTDPLAIANELDGIDADVVITNAADNVAWYTGLPSAYLPPERMSLTGTLVDRSALFAALPCALAEHRGVVALFDAAFFGALGRDELEPLVVAGKLDAERRDTLTIYRPAAQACDD